MSKMMGRFGFCMIFYLFFLYTVLVMDYEHGLSCREPHMFQEAVQTVLASQTSPAVQESLAQKLAEARSPGSGSGLRG